MISVLKVLICDEDSLSSTMLEETIIRRQEANVQIFSKSDTLLKKLRDEPNEKYDLLFINVKESGESLIPVMKEIKEENETIQVVACGGLELTDEVLKTLLEIGVKDILPKPYETEEIKLYIE